MLNGLPTGWQRAAAPFALTGAAAIIGGGLLAAVVAHAPPERLVWMSAYLVLIVGVAQWVFGVGRAWLVGPVPCARMLWSEWLALNLGNAAVMAGTLAHGFVLVCAGTLLFAAAMALFLFGTRRAPRSRWLLGYRVLLAAVFASSLIGLGLSAAANLY